MPEKSVKQIWPPHRKLRKPDAEKDEKTDKKKRATSDQRFAWILTEQKVRSYYRDGHHREAEQHPSRTIGRVPLPAGGRIIRRLLQSVSSLSLCLFLTASKCQRLGGSLRTLLRFRIVPIACRRLQYEVPEKHVLHGAKVRAVATRIDQDDVLFTIQGRKNVLLAPPSVCRNFPLQLFNSFPLGARHEQSSSHRQRRSGEPADRRTTFFRRFPHGILGRICRRSTAVAHALVRGRNHQSRQHCRRGLGAAGGDARHQAWGKEYRLGSSQHAGRGHCCPSCSRVRLLHTSV